MTTQTAAANQVLFASHASKSDSADVLMAVRGFSHNLNLHQVNLVGARGSKFDMSETFTSEGAAIEFLKEKAAGLGCDIKVFCAQYDVIGFPVPWKMTSQF